MIVPPNIALGFQDKGEIHTTAASALIIRGTISGPTKQIFFGAGTVTFAGNTSIPVLFPEWWGAASNSAQDDSRAIQAAINAAANTGGVVRLTRPRYLCATTLKIGSGVRLTGAGSKSVLFFENKLGLASAIEIEKASSVEVSDLTIEGSTAVPTVSRLISINGGSDIHIKNCFLSGANRRPESGQLSAIAFEGSSNLWIEDNDIAKNGPAAGEPFGVEIGGYLLGGTEIHVRRNKIRGARTLYGIHLTDASKSDVLDNSVDLGNQDNGDNHSGYGITFYSLKPPNDVSNEVSGNTVTNCVGQGIYFVGVDQSKITRNTVTNVASKQADTVLGVGAVSLNSTHDIEVTDNVLRTSGKSGIILANTSQVKLTNNNIADTKSASIWLRHVERQISVVGNSIDTSAEAGIRVTGDSSKLNIAGNRIAHIGQWAIIVMQGATESVLADNSINSVASGGGIYVGGGAVAVHHNEIRDVYGSGIDHRRGGAIIDENTVVGVDPTRTTYGIVANGDGYSVDSNQISNCLQGINLSEGRSSVRNNLLKGNRTPLVLGKGVLASGNDRLR